MRENKTITAVVTAFAMTGLGMPVQAEPVDLDEVKEACEEAAEFLVSQQWGSGCIQELHGRGRRSEHDFGSRGVLCWSARRSAAAPTTRAGTAGPRRRASPTWRKTTEARDPACTSSSTTAPPT